MASTDVGVCSAISVTCEASDRDDDELTYTWEASGGFIIGEGGSVTYNAPEVIGSQTIAATVQDEGGREDAESIQVQIVLANPPLGRSEPVGTFGQIWRECEIRRRLGWAIGEEHETPGAQQYFEQGVMFWRQDMNEIYVLTQDGSWQAYVDTWEEGMDRYSCPDITERETPPTPIRGFGKVWCEQLGGPFAAIGRATDQEQGYQARWQRFEHGLIGQGINGRVYVLYEDHSWQLYLSPVGEPLSVDPNSPSQRIRVDGRAWVCTAHDSLAIRSEPGLGSSEIARLEPGTYVTVVDGPAYADGWPWWKVRPDSGVVGWVAEGGDEIDPRFLCPE